MEILVANKKTTFTIQKGRYSFDLGCKNDDQEISVFLLASERDGDPYTGAIEYGCYQTLDAALIVKDKLAAALKKKHLRVSAAASVF